MTRQSRTLLILGVMGIACVVLLGLMANRYGAILQRMKETEESRPRATTHAAAPQIPAPAGSTEVSGAAPAQAVASYIVVRRALKERLDAPEVDGETAFVVERERALSDNGVRPTEYARVRGLYREWRHEPASVERDYAEIFRRRRAELARLDLGPYESLDR
jgi:hypothetical protein